MTTLFEPSIFQRLRLLEKVSQDLKYIRYNYMTQMKNNPCYERPSYIPIIEWENLKKDAIEKKEINGGEIVPPKERRCWKYG